MSKTNILSLPETEFVHPGSRACSGCGLSIAYRTGLKALGRNSILVVPPSCLTVLQGLYPIAATKLPCLNVTFASTAASAAGVSAALRALKKKGTIVAAWAGDGGTADIGIQSLSGACERGDDIIFICYDNEAYMNTGVQRSGTTPQGALTTTTPLKGKIQAKKNMPSIMAAHGIKYVATASASYPLDLYDKVKKSKKIQGVKYIHIHTPCPPGWGFDPRFTVKIGKIAVETGLYDLYEVEDSKFSLSGPSARLVDKKRSPVENYFKLQSRFRSISKSKISRIQEQINKKWEGYSNL
ncbi:MAG: pyruvate synthase subunit beta [Deltaproteobacteria bacterium]|nr:pyruvate synthase subunit beta [Deltaproteobacteria bacterium]